MLPSTAHTQPRNAFCPSTVNQETQLRPTKREQRQPLTGSHPECLTIQQQSSTTLKELSNHPDPVGKHLPRNPVLPCTIP